MTNPMLEIDQVTIRFGAIEAVADATFSLGDDELLALIGPNGAGKTALLNSVCGIYVPVAGDIRVNGRSTVGSAPVEIASSGIGRAFQHGELFKGLTVTENLLVGRTPKLWRSAAWAGVRLGPYLRREVEAVARVEEVMDFFEISRHRTTPVEDLPFGLQKLVGVARALCGDPKVLLLDEPSSGLTRQEKEDFSRFLLRIRHDLGLPVLWIEHDMQMVMDLADRIVVLDYGRIIADGPPDQVASNPAVIDAYLGRPMTTSDAPAAASVRTGSVQR